MEGQSNSWMKPDKAGREGKQPDSLSSSFSFTRPGVDQTYHSFILIALSQRGGQRCQRLCAPPFLRDGGDDLLRLREATRLSQRGGQRCQLLCALVFIRDGDDHPLGFRQDTLLVQRGAHRSQ